jgi:sirohydrochlorin ferrochelatase
MKALIFLAHGSKVIETHETLTKYLEALEARAPYDVIEGAYLQIMKPDLHDVIERLVEKGAMEIDIFPFFLFKGNHLLMDIPEEMAKAQQNHPGLNIKLLDCIGFDDLLVELILKRIK